MSNRKKNIKTMKLFVASSQQQKITNFFLQNRAESFLEKLIKNGLKIYYFTII